MSSESPTPQRESRHKSGQLTLLEDAWAGASDTEIAVSGSHRDADTDTVNSVQDEAGHGQCDAVTASATGFDDAETGAETDWAAGCGRWLDNPRAAFAQWKLSQRVRGVEFEAHSIEQYASMWGRFCTWLAQPGAGRPLRIDEVSEIDIERFLAQLRGGRLRDRAPAQSTIRRYLFLLHRTFEHLTLLEVVDANPCAELPQLKRHQASARPARALLLPAQEERFIAWSLARPERRWDHCRNRALRLLFLASGITVGEARALRVRDVLIAADGMDAVSVAAHGNTAARSAPIAAFAVEAVANWLRVRAMLRAPGEQLFNTKTMRPSADPGEDSGLPAPASLSAEEIYDIVAAGLRECGYVARRAGPATLRNAFMARQIRNGVTLERIRDWVGLRTVEPLRLLQRQVPIRSDGVVPK